MKIVFFSNYFNHHQQALSDALWTLTGGEYHFIAAEEMPQERSKLGCAAGPRDYVLPLAGNEETVTCLLREADVVIAGSAPEMWVRKRIRTGKLLLRYSERPLRNGLEPVKFLPRLLRWHWRNPRRKTIYLLCSSAYTAEDYAKFGLFRDRAYRWGYFPETKRYDTASLFAQKRSREILWCGRFTELKHPEAVLEIVRRLHAAGLPFHVRFLGMGELEQFLKERTSAWGLSEHVSFLGAQRPEVVRRAMERAGIFLFTSDHREGWGVVLNEAMNSGCAVVASDAAGAVPYLLRHGENGLVYPSGDLDSLTEAVRHLLEVPQEQRRLGQQAYATITELWNAETAARRLLALSERLLAGESGKELYSEGPCSPDRGKERGL